MDAAGAYVDVAEFTTLIARKERDALERALKLYGRGPFLPACRDDWAKDTRLKFAADVLKAHEWLADEATRREDYARAMEHLQAILQADPWRETAIRTLITAMAASGDPEQAIQFYRAYRARLRTSGTTPEKATIDAYLKIKAAYEQHKRERRQEPPAGAPPLHTIPRALPSPLPTLYGRSEMIVEVVAALDRAGVVTLTGCGGIGKTQLAVQIAHDALGNYDGGAWFVGLAECDDPQRIAPEIAAVLGVPEQAGHSLEALLLVRLRAQPLLLILDNCEHLRDNCAALVEMLRNECPYLHVLVTSRQPLGLPGEIAWQVSPLALPPSHSPAPLDDSFAEAQTAPAVQLFLDRAAQVRPGFALTAWNATAIVRICRILEGIPLAIELAAAWVRSLSTEEIAIRLDDCLALLVRGASGDNRRQQTLQSALDWSYALLGEQERRLLAALSIFVGGWTLQAAEEIGSNYVERRRVVHLLAELVDKSLALFEEIQGAGRYRFLTPIRQYAQQKRQQEIHLPDLEAHHLAHFMQVAAEAAPNLVGSGQADWLDRLEKERDNFRAALGLCCDRHDAASGLQLAASLGRFWQIRGYYAEGQSWLEQLLDDGEPANDPTRLKALGAAGGLAFRRADLVSAQRFYREMLALAERLGNPRSTAAALGNLANVSSELGDLAVAHSYFERCLALFRDLQDERAVALTLSNLAVVANRQNEYALACRYNEEAICLLERMDVLELAIALNNLADARQTLGEHTVAERHLRRSMQLSLSLQSRRTLANSLQIYLCALVDRGRMEHAAVLVGALEALRHEIGVSTPADARAEYERCLAQLRLKLTEKRFKECVARGKAMSLEEIVASAMSVD
jgi:predicted ATPase